MRLGLLEILLIVAAIFLFVGAKQLPKIAMAIKESKKILKESDNNSESLEDKQESKEVKDEEVKVTANEQE